jgi:conjugative transfer region lipoprotein (TIGR03751 family)
MIMHKPTATLCTWINAVLTLLVAITLSACSTAGDTMPQGGPTMSQVYEEAMQKSNGATLDQARAQISAPVSYNSIDQLSPYTRTANNEINNLFPLLPNPQIVMYIYPHLAEQDEAPVPGYSTAFSLFEREHYALPGEAN